MPGTEIVKRPSQPPAVPLERKRESEALAVRAVRGSARNRHLSVPLAVPVVTWTAGEIMHAYGAAPYAGVGGAALAGAVWFFAPHKWTDGDGKPRWPEVWYARLSAAGGAAWLTAAAHFGPASGVAGEVLGGFLAAGTGTWGFFWWQHKRPRGMKRRQRLIMTWNGWWQQHCAAWNLAGSRVIDVSDHRAQVRLRVQLWAGRQSIQHVKQAVHLIESGLEGIAEPGRVRVDHAGRNGSQVDVFIKRENPLREIVEWDPALAPKSVHDQAVDGLTETGQWKTVPMRVNKFVNGKTRSGKSNDLLVSAAQLSGCPDDRQVLIDLKGGRSARPLLEAAAVDYVITDVDEARVYLLMLTMEIRARAMYCYDGHEQLLATVDVPAVHTLIDEVNGLTSVQNGDTECSNHLATVASAGSGLEIYVEVYTQYGSLEDSVRTPQTRANLGLRKCYAVEEARDGQFTIPEYDKFDASTLEERGTHLLKLGKMFAEQIRSPLMTHKLLKSITAANARALAPRPAWRLACGDWPCPLGGTWQEWWDRRWLRLNPAFHAVSPQYQAAAAQYGETAGAGVTLADVNAAAADILRVTGGAVTVSAAAHVTIPPAPSAPGEGDGASVAARIEAETQGPAFPPDRRIVARLGQVQQAKKERFADVLAGASRGISPAQLEDECGMSQSWIYNQLSPLLKRGVITQPRRGLYVPVPGTDIHEAIRRIEADADALLKDARKAVRLQAVS